MSSLIGGKPIFVLRIKYPNNFSEQKVREFKKRKFRYKAKKIQKQYWRMFAGFSAALCEIFLFKPCCVPSAYAPARRRMHMLREVKFVRSKKAFKLEKSNI